MMRKNFGKMSCRMSKIAMLLVILFSLVILYHPDISTADANSNATFRYSPSDPEVDEEIIFTALGPADQGWNYTWNFDDGHHAKGREVIHSYDSSGFYDVILIVVDHNNEVSSTTKTIHVRSDFEPFPGLAGGAIGIIILFVYLCVFVLIFGFYPANIILGGIFAYKAYQRAKKNDHMEETKPYLVAFLIAGLVSMFMPYFALISVIAHVIIYTKLKKMEKEIIPMKKGHRKPERSRFQ